MNRPLLSIIAIIMTLIIMSSCGGDSSSGPVEEQADIEYSGINDPAPLDQDNAGEIIQAALYSGYLALGPNFSQDSAAAHSDAPGMSLLSVLEDLAWEIEDQFLRDLSHSKTIAGNCPDNPGYASYTVTENVSDRTFSGEIAFYNFCNDYVIMNGQAKIEGQFERDRDAFGRFTLTFSWLKASTGNRSYTLNGAITIVMGNPTSTVTMNLALKDNKTGTIYKLEDFEVVITRETGYAEYEMSGKFYHPDYGHVTVSTPAAVRIYYGDEYPSSGTLSVTGQNQTTAQMAFLTETTYKIEVDLDGDGVFDWDSGELSW